MKGKLGMRQDGVVMILPCKGCGKDFLSKPRMMKGYRYNPGTCEPCNYKKRVEKLKSEGRYRANLDQRLASRHKRIAAGVNYGAGKWYGDPPTKWYYTKLRRSGMERDEARDAAVAFWRARQATPGAYVLRIERAGGMVERVSVSGDLESNRAAIQKRNPGAEIFVERIVFVERAA